MPEPDASRPASILIIRTGHLGDTITAIPALRLIRAWAPGANLTVLCDRPLGGQMAARSVLEPMGVADRCEVFAARPRWRAVWQVREVVRRVRPDLAIILGQAGATPMSLARQVLVLRLLGLADVRVVNPVPAPGVSWPGEAERLCRGLHSVGIAGERPTFDIPHFVGAREGIARRLADMGLGVGVPYLVFCGGGKAPTQRWPLERYARVLSRLAEAHDWPLVAIGTARELDQLRTAFRAARLDVRYLDGLDLPQLFELMRGATAYLGNDTGPMHVAAAVSCPVVVVMSARNAPGQWYPEVERRLVFRKAVSCQNCFLQDCVAEGHRCMTGIGVDEVVMGTLQFLDGLSPPSVALIGERRH